jgi:transposase InsO family protein
LVKPLVVELEGVGKKVEFIRCDNAGENLKQFQDLCKVHGIVIEFTAPHTPQQNGVAEQALVTIRNRAHAMMVDAKLTQESQSKLWGEAVRHASYVRQR